MHELVKAVESENLREHNPKQVPIEALRPGATVRVHFRIVEGTRERVQPFQGVVIRVREGGPGASIAVRRTGAHGVGVERIFPLHSPRLEQIEILRQGHARRANLYYLRERTGKAARLRDKRTYRREAEPDAAEEA